MAHKLISHRGNLTGPQPKYENTICYIDYALSKGFDVEIDVWKFPEEDCFYFGHDKPNLSQSVPLWYLENPNLWIHCKNQTAWQFLVENKRTNAFIHTDEPWVQTTNGTTWVHSKYNPPDFYAMFKKQEYDGWYKNYKGPIFTYFVNQKRLSGYENCDYGLCSDYIDSYRGC